MADIRNYRDAEGKRIQTYFAAYMILNGFTTPEEAARKTSRHGKSFHDYLAWNQQRWAEFEREAGLPHDGPRASYAKEFTDWLQARCDAFEAQAA